MSKRLRNARRRVHGGRFRKIQRFAGPALMEGFKPWLRRLESMWGGHD